LALIAANCSGRIIAIQKHVDKASSRIR
jgi:hypothetical protein